MKGRVHTRQENQQKGLDWFPSVLKWIISLIKTKLLCNWRGWEQMFRGNKDLMQRKTHNHIRNTDERPQRFTGRAPSILLNNKEIRQRANRDFSFFNPNYNRNIINNWEWRFNHWNQQVPAKLQRDSSPLLTDYFQDFISSSPPPCHYKAVLFLKGAEGKQHNLSKENDYCWEVLRLQLCEFKWN